MSVLFLGSFFVARGHESGHKVRAPRLMSLATSIHQHGVDIWQRGPEPSRCGSRLSTPREPAAFLGPQAGSSPSSRTTTAASATTLPSGATGRGFVSHFPKSPALPPLSSAELRGWATAAELRGDGIFDMLRGMATAVELRETAADAALGDVQLVPPHLPGSGPKAWQGTSSQTVTAGGLPEPMPPPSIVPREYHVTGSVPVPPEGRGTYASEWDEQGGQWRVTVFPAQRPVGHEQVGHLRTCLNRMIEAQTSIGKLLRSPRLSSMSGRSSTLLDERPFSSRSSLTSSSLESTLLDVFESDSHDVERTYRELHSVYAAGMHELARQTSAHCAERGQLLMNVWCSVEALRDRMYEMQKTKADAAVKRQTQLDQERGDALFKLRSLENLHLAQQARVNDLAKHVHSLKVELKYTKVKAESAAREAEVAAKDRELAEQKADSEEMKVLRIERDAMKALAEGIATERDGLHRQLESRDRLMAMLHTLRAALKSVEEELATSQSRRKAAEAQLAESCDRERLLRTQLETVTAEKSSGALAGEPTAAMAEDGHEKISHAPSSGAASRQLIEVS